MTDRLDPDGAVRAPLPIPPEESSDLELLARALGGRSALLEAAGLLTAFGSIHALARASPVELRSALPLRSRRDRLGVVFALAQRLQGRPLGHREVLRQAEDVFRHFLGRLEGRMQEVFLVLHLDARHRVVGESRISEGSLSASLVHPREVFRSAIRRGAGSIVLVHNHPSGDPTPSPEDLGITRRLRRAGDLVGIRVVDHVIVGREGYFSFQEGGYL
jgi:DNA repair protein RadC